jgi:hypothetical protein
MKLSFFPSFFDHPAKIKFQEQEENEIIELFLRRHFITNVPWIFVAVVAFFLPLIFVQLDQIYGLNLILRTPINIAVGGLVIYFLIILAYVIENFLFWYFNIYIVTNIHIVDINFHSILSREVLEIELNDIENVSSKINGIIRSFFNFGDVVIKTAADKADLTFSEVPRPDFVADRIQDLRAAFLEGNP